MTEKSSLQVGALLGRARYRLLGKRRVRVSELMRLVAVNTVLGALGRAAIETIAAGATLQSVSSGRTLLRQNEEPDSAYVILHGTADVVVSVAGVDTTIAEVERGEVIGEMGVILNQPRMASVRTTTAMQVLRIDRLVLLAALDEEPEVGAPHSPDNRTTGGQ